MFFALVALLAPAAAITINLPPEWGNYSLAEAPTPYSLTFLGSTGDLGGAESLCASSDNSHFFIVDADNAALHVFEMAMDGTLDFVQDVNLSDASLVPNSCYVKNGVVVVVAGGSGAAVNTSGTAYVYDEADLSLITTLATGTLPDHVSATPSGSLFAVATEGEPQAIADGGRDPSGGVTLFKATDYKNASTYEVCTVRFSQLSSFNETAARARNVHQGITTGDLVNDLEPEYIAYDPQNEDVAYLILQENNAIVTMDVSAGAFSTCTADAILTQLDPIGWKDWGASFPYNKMDPSNEDDNADFRDQPVFSMCQPDSAVGFVVGGQTYVAMACEGDGKDPEEYTDGDEYRVRDLAEPPFNYTFEEGRFAPYNATTVWEDQNLGRLKIAINEGIENGVVDQLVGFGGRSMLIAQVSASGLSIVSDTGGQLDEVLARDLPDNYMPWREDDKGVEPEGLAVAEVDGTTFAVVGLERGNALALYDVSTPASPVLHGMFAGEDGAMISPEALVIVPADDSPLGVPLVVVTAEVSSDVSVFALTSSPYPTMAPSTLAPSAAPSTAMPSTSEPTAAPSTMAPAAADTPSPSTPSPVESGAARVGKAVAAVLAAGVLAIA